MAYSTTVTALKRMYALITIIPVHGNGATAQELCNRLNSQGIKISKRSVLRDLDGLSEVLPELELIDDENVFRWRWSQGSCIGRVLKECLVVRP